LDENICCHDEEGIRLLADCIQLLEKAVGLLFHEVDVDRVEERAEFRLGAEQLLFFLSRAAPLDF
jgi:hypothetical protein